MLSLKIDGLRTVNQFGENANVFDPLQDALALTMDISSSDDLLSFPQPFFEAVFQIIDPITENVIVNMKIQNEFEWGPNFWISLGNNWGPNKSDYDTPERWKLKVKPDRQGSELKNEGRGIFGFRGIIKAGSRQIEPPIYEAFDISDIRWFRVLEKVRID